VSTPRDVLADAQRFYRRSVYRSWVHGYLSGRFLAGMIGPAGVGYAPKGWAATSDHLRQLGHDLESIVAAGVAVHTNRGLRDVMRDRLIFRVHDHTGNLVAFLGRANPATDPRVPKYLNTPTTGLYDKRSTLYGLGEQSDRLRAGAVPLIVEGPMDKLAVDRAVTQSSANVVALASCGTSLTGEHLARIASVTEAPVWFCFDSDLAGRAATLRVWELTRDAGRARQMVVRLPAGHDPASVHPRVLNAAIAAATPLSVVAAECQLSVWGKPDNPVRAAWLVAELARRDASRIAPEDAGLWITTLARHSGLPIADVQASLLDAISSPPISRLRDACFPVAGPSARPHPPPAPIRQHQPAGSAAGWER